jgi:methionine aminopeptidase
MATPAACISSASRCRTPNGSWTAASRRCGKAYAASVRARASATSGTRSSSTPKVVREYCGHGIGRIYHEDPQVLHYGKPGTGLELRAGMTFTIEPMINAGKRDVKLLPDGWTVVTRDHSLSAQWEHTVLVTDEGFEVLTQGAR